MTKSKDEKILAFDTAMSACSVALYDAEKDVFIDETIAMVRGQAEQLVPMIERVMGRGGVSYADLNRILTTVGPGAFTGLRIGLSTARALGVTLNVPVSGVSTMEVLAHKYFLSNEKKKDVDLLVVLETKRQDFYYQFFSSDGDMDDSTGAASAEDIFALIKRDKETVVVGDAVSRFSMLLQEDKSRKVDLLRFEPDAYSLIEPHNIITLYQAGSCFQSCDPLYLREADVSKSKKIYRKLKSDD